MLRHAWLLFCPVPGIRSTRHALLWKDPERNSAAPAPAPAASAGGKPVAAPVAGTLLRYAVSEGASVTPDTTVIIIESMKMELEIKAGAAGKVHFIAATGSQIAQGATLAEIQ